MGRCGGAWRRMSFGHARVNIIPRSVRTPGGNMESIRRSPLKLAILLAIAPLAAVASPATSMKVPLHFEPEAGAAARYVARDGESSFYFTADGAVVGDASGAVQLGLSGANRDARIEAQDLLPGHSHYLRGADPSRWRRDVPHFGRLRYHDVYPGVDVVYYGREQQIEHDFV